MRPSEIWSQPMDPSEKLVLLAIADYGNIAFPRQGTLATKTGLSRRTVQRIVARLSEEVGTSPIRIRVERRKRGLVYRLEKRHHDAPESVTMTPEKRHHDASRSVTMTHPSKLVQGTSPPNPESAEADWGGCLQLVEAIRLKYPRETPEAHGRVCRRILARYGIEGAESVECFRLLLTKWLERGSRPGQSAYELLAGYTEDLGGARNERAVLLSKIKDPNR